MLTAMLTMKEVKTTEKRMQQTQQEFVKSAESRQPRAEYVSQSRRLARRSSWLSIAAFGECIRAVLELTTNSCYYPAAVMTV